MSPQSTMPTVLGGLSTAFAAACRQARNDGEVYDRCRQALARLYGSDAIWLAVTTPTGTTQVGPASPPAGEPAEVFRCQSGDTAVAVHSAPEIAEELRAHIAPICFGLSVVLELRGVMMERRVALDDATFQLRAMRQVVRLLSTVHSPAETEHLILDFMAEVFFAWWAALYRPADASYHPHKTRALGESVAFEPIPLHAFDHALPPGSPVTPPDDVRVGGLVPKGTELVVPTDAGGERLGFILLGPRINGQPYGRSERELAGTLSLAAAIALKNAELVERLHSAATTDGLTGLLNRRAIEERLDAEISRSTRHQVKTTVALVDLDRFKLINDTLGHAAGDRFLVHVGELLQRHVRSLDVAGRLGGDEFLVILPMTSDEEATIFVNRLRRGLETFSASHPEFGQTTISVGLAEAPRDGTTVAGLLASADGALYNAKGAGRNVIRIAGQT
jgi:diguanylate cyclase (GGDEF)-like protein